MMEYGLVMHRSRNPFAGVRSGADVISVMLAGFVLSASLGVELGAQDEIPLRGRMNMSAMPEELTTACAFDRSSLVVRELASNLAVSPGMAERVPGGWLVYDRYERQVIELDDRLEEVTRWGRRGEGPLEYDREPAGFGRTDAGETLLFRLSPSVIAFDSQTSHVIEGLGIGRVQHAVNLDERILMANDAGVFETALGQREAVMKWGSRNLGIVVGDRGVRPIYRLRMSPDGNLYAAAMVQSWIWSLDDGEEPEKLVERCVPDLWRTAHVEAFPVRPRNITGFPPEFAAHITAQCDPCYRAEQTLMDFTILRTRQVLAWGALDANADDDQSVELYDADGDLLHAWLLPRRTWTDGLFDPFNPRRLLVWGGEFEDHVRLIEIAGEGYPAATMGRIP